MFDRIAFAFCSVLGSCTVIGAPILVQESNRLRSVGGDEGAHAPDVTLLTKQGGGTLDNTLRASICRELGFVNATHVNNSDELDSSNGWIYVCFGNENISKKLVEKLDSDYYEGSLKDESNPVRLRCKSFVRGDSSSVDLKWSQCKKK